MPLPGATLWPLPVAAYRALGEAGLVPKNTELLYGLVYIKPSKSPLHSFLIARLLRWLQAVAPPTHLVRSEQPVTCGDSEAEPDISVVLGTEADFLADHPHTAELVIEVSITNHDYDRSKLPAYAKAGVKECWLVLGPEKRIEVYRQPRDGRSHEQIICGPTGNVVSTALPEFTLPLDALFLELND